MKLAALILIATCATPQPKAIYIQPTGGGPVEMIPVAADARRPLVLRQPTDPALVLRPVIAIPVGGGAPKYRANLILLADQRPGIPPEFWSAVGATGGALPTDVRILDAQGRQVQRMIVRVPLSGTLNYPLPPLPGTHTVLVLLRPGLMQWGMVSLIDNTSNDPTTVEGRVTLVEVQK